MATFYDKLRIRSNVYQNGLLEIEEKIEVDVENLLSDDKIQLMVQKSSIPYQVVGNISSCAEVLNRRLKLNYEHDTMCLTWTQCREVVGASKIIPKLPKLMILEYDKPKFDDGDLTLLQILLDLESPNSSTNHKVIMVMPPETEDLNNILEMFLADFCIKPEFGENKKDKEQTASSLIEAASWGNYLELERFIESGDDIAMKDENGQTALHKAAKIGHKRIAMLLLVNNADVGILDNQKMTPMHHACDGGFDDIVRLLMDYGASFDAVESTGWSPLMFASGKNHLKVIETLMVQGVEINAVSNQKWTALHVAARRGSLDAVKLLIGYGANHKLLDFEGKTAMELALQEGCDNVVEFLLNLTCP